MWVIWATANQTFMNPVTPGHARKASVASKAASMATRNQIVGRVSEMWFAFAVNAFLKEKIELKLSERKWEPLMSKIEFIYTIRHCFDRAKCPTAAATALITDFFIGWNKKEI